MIPPSSRTRVLVLVGVLAATLAAVLLARYARYGESGELLASASAPGRADDGAMAAYEWDPEAVSALESLAKSRGLDAAEAARLLHKCVLDACPDDSTSARAVHERELARTIAWRIGPVTRMVPLDVVLKVVVDRRRQGTPIERVIETLR